MSDIIKLLPDALANQIAAGEVVQRPASVVKELMENAIDAKSLSIQLIIKESGKQLIQVVDDGSGMSETDARICFERHATSKISTTDDLFKIKTMGFRGEALASIAAVAQVELKTNKDESSLGTYIKIEASDVKIHESVHAPKGTQISVKNLFYNIPARRNFLKTNTVELKHIIDEFIKIALSYPNIAFSLISNDQEIYKLAPGKLGQRIMALFGNSYKEQIIPVKEDNSPVALLHGYVGKPDGAKKTRGEQFFFVNNRFFKHPYLHHAVMEAFDGLLQEECFPFYAIFLEIDPAKIDVNVHPTKTEIKFEDERSMYGLVNAAVRRTLGTHLTANKIDFNMDVNAFKLSFNNQLNKSNFTKAHEAHFESKTNTNHKNWEKLYDFKDKSGDAESYADLPKQEVLTIQSALNKPNQLFETAFHSDGNLYQIHNRYIVSQIRSGIMLIDQKAAVERIKYEWYFEILQNKTNASQQFLFPISIELTPADMVLVTDLEQEIHNLGFSFSYLGKTTIVLNGIPADVKNENEKLLFEELIEQIKIYKSELKLDSTELLARSIAKRSGVNSIIKLGQSEMSELIDKLFACKQPNYSPSGDKTFVKLDFNNLSQLFQ